MFRKKFKFLFDYALHNIVIYPTTILSGKEIVKFKEREEQREKVWEHYC